MQALRAIAAPLTRPLEARGAQMLGQAFANASDAMTAKGRGDDAVKVMNGRMTYSEFAWNTGKDLVGGGLGTVAGRVVGGSAGNYANVFVNTGFNAGTKGL